jgi:RND family efflux transporter MFP subunit
MTHRFSLGLGAALVFGCCLAVVGCGRTPQLPPAEPPVVTVVYPAEREVTDYAEFTGFVQPVDIVQVQARVSGYLVKVLFKEGAEVKKDDILFEIDPRPYQAQLDKDLATLKQAEANVKQSQADFVRALTLIKKAGISQAEYDQALANKDVALANVEAAKANIETSKLNLEFCTVRSPINGLTSNYAKTLGNLVTQDKTQLTTIVSTDPMYVYFAMDEHTVLHIKKLSTEGKFKSLANGGIPVFLGLANEQGFPHKGTINFADNQLKPGTGTLTVRGVFPNPDRLLTPGLFARVRIPVSEPHPALLVPDQTIGTDQGKKVLYLVNAKNEVVARPVKLGALHDGLRAIEAGLKSGERVIVDGLQWVRPGVTVNPTLVSG